MNEEIKKLPTPAVIVDLDIVEKNIMKMREGAKQFRLQHRPHI